MFHHIEGVVSELEPYRAVLDCGGIGFELTVTLNTLGRLKLGERAKLYVSEAVREDSFDLYGFWSKSERRCYELLIGVSGVGPKAAISILSSGTPESLAMAIVSGDEKALTVAQGIGKKIAQRVILELKDKMAGETEGLALPRAPAAGGAAAPADKRLADATAALAVLGYTPSEIAAALRGADPAGMDTESLVKYALRALMKGGDGR